MWTCHDAAREYLMLGLHPIPCAPRSKRPLVEWKRYQDAPPLLEEIDTWWSQWPDANVALVLGRGTFAVDLDGGREAESLLKARGIYFPPAPRSKTAGGFHVFFSAPGPVPDRVALLSTGGKKPQVDIRGVGIVVAPPSIHPDGPTYAWQVPLSWPFPPAPEGLLRLITEGAPKTTTTTSAGWVADALRGVGEGLRDATCTRLAGYFLGQGIDPRTVETLLLESFARNCTPPLDSHSVKKCVHSIAKREAATGENEERGLAPVPLSAVLEDVVARLKTGPASAVRGPFPTLNHFLSGGFAPGELIYLGARPGVGKTAFGLEIARAVAADDVGVLVISREMVNAALARRLMAQEGSIRATALRSGRLTDDDWLAIPPTVARLSKRPIWLTDEVLSIREIAAMATTFRGSPGLGLLIVDYLQLVRAPKEIRERRHQVEAVSQGLKGLALGLKIPVLCLSSLSRAPSGEKDRAPTLSDLRESGELEHDADVILLLHREPMKPETVCFIAKNREGQVGKVTLRFQAETVHFYEPTDRRRPEEEGHA
jgi:hypothetical protein